jgi:hypothetical protein
MSLPVRLKLRSGGLQLAPLAKRFSTTFGESRDGLDVGVRGLIGLAIKR